MPKIVFDIETIGENFDTDFNNEEKEYLLKYAQTDEEKTEAKLKTALSPLTGIAVAVGYFLPEKQTGFVDMVSDKEKDFEENGYKYHFLKTESDLLTKFWTIVKSYTPVITFNGRGFDAPFLMIRSAVNKVKLSRNLLPYRYDAKIHCDLAEQMSFYGILKYPKTLHFFTRAFGIPTPKDEMCGRQVTEYYTQGKHREIATYCLKDVVATAKLYEYWEEYLNL